MASNNRKRDEHRRQKRLQKERKRSHIDRDRRNVAIWSPKSRSNPAMLLEFFAPPIEAAGSLSTAIKLGLISAGDNDLKQLARFVPRSRGGLIDHPDADADWRIVVDESVRKSGYDLESTRRMVRQLTERE